MRSCFISPRVFFYVRMLTQHFLRFVAVMARNMQDRRKWFSFFKPRWMLSKKTNRASVCRGFNIINWRYSKVPKRLHHFQKHPWWFAFVTVCNKTSDWGNSDEDTTVGIDWLASCELDEYHTEIFIIYNLFMDIILFKKCVRSYRNMKKIIIRVLSLLKYEFRMCGGTGKSYGFNYYPLTCLFHGERRLNYNKNINYEDCIALQDGI